MVEPRSAEPVFGSTLMPDSSQITRGSPSLVRQYIASNVASTSLMVSTASSNTETPSGVNSS